MAFLTKFGSALRQAAARSQLVSSGRAGAIPALLVVQRDMSSSKLFVGGLSWGTDEKTLRDAFSSFGDVTEVKIITDRDTGRSRGFGFVSFTTENEAQTALQSMDGRELAGRTIRVDYATQRMGLPPPPRGGFGAGYGGSNFSGGYGGGGGAVGGAYDANSSSPGYGSGSSGAPYAGNNGDVPHGADANDGLDQQGNFGGNWRQ